ncbi:inverse autotransporter beta domain-containing protein [Xenorhabdus innexi]|uniref:Bacterial Ig-like domain n=1 Tax=Xenorhabdus innexi TaxID=290109 RepID=A0A1N6MSV3_9GAMM|nr:inverse autotransporter beta domain-containing protein [Xenorhabdus innexi]PHM37323.1 putative Bacterial Ig-like domain [Xenorhabdus innexi]SIP71854.1 putative invasin [Xenorhabdus innexi]
MYKKLDKPWVQNQRSLLKQVAWINIIAQFSFPLASAFVPTIAAAETLTTSQYASLIAIPTEPYILKSGETINTIAKRYNFTIEQLKEINKLRTFKQPFSELSAGDEINVPRPRPNKYLPFNYFLSEQSASRQAELKPLLAGQAPSAPPPVTDDTERTLADSATRIGEILSSDKVGNSAINQLSNLAVGKANQQLQNWLKHYGTARVQANIDRQGHLDGSQLDMLLPLYDSNSKMDFTQFGLRRIDKRNTINIGVGQRQFFDNWMLGYNAFLDHDFTGSNTRLGLGAEYTRNYLKLGMNGYLRLSNWRESRLLEDYDERPANGFDLRAQGYIPALPQFGGKLVYEQYFGNEVGLINKEHRRKNPAAFTAGINYTPIPLLTFGIDRKQDMSGNGDTQFNLELNYEIGTPWSKQVNPDAVGFRHTLQGSRYDLVDRNNQIVLEYRKREVIRLTLDSLISGHAGEIKPIHISVNSKYGLKTIQWDTASLLASGGKIERQNDNRYLLTLPKYHHDGNNIYAISAVAYDEHDNASRRAETQVQVLQAEASVDKSTFTVRDHDLSADDHSSTLLKLVLKDGNGNPIPDSTEDIKFTSSELSGTGDAPKIGKIKETQPGTYEALLTAGEKTGVLTVTANFKELNFKPIAITFFHPDKPIIKDVKMSGRLEMGHTLNATYTFNANNGEGTDRSRYVWGDKGNVDITKGSTITQSGKIPAYTLTLSDAGRVKALAVQAQNGLHITGNTKTIDSSMSQAQGNDTYGGTEGGKIKGIADNLKVTVNTGEAKKGETITLSVKAFNHGQPVRNVPVEVKAIEALNRQSVHQSITLQINGNKKHYQGVTGDNGILSLPVTDPQGLGVKTTLQVAGYGVSAPKTEYVIFTVATSPNSQYANFWGHMADTVTGGNGRVFSRPLLQTELKAMGMGMEGMTTYPENGEYWPRRVYKGAIWYCHKIHKKLPTKEDLLSLYQIHQQNEMHDLYGWPQFRSYRSATPGIDEDGDNAHFAVNIDNGTAHVINETVTDYVVCI